MKTIEVAELATVTGAGPAFRTPLSAGLAFWGTGVRAMRPFFPVQVGLMEAASEIRHAAVASVLPNPRLAKVLHQNYSDAYYHGLAK